MLVCPGMDTINQFCLKLGLTVKVLQLNGMSTIADWSYLKYAFYRVFIVILCNILFFDKILLVPERNFTAVSSA